MAFAATTWSPAFSGARIAVVNRGHAGRGGARGLGGFELDHAGARTSKRWGLEKREYRNPDLRLEAGFTLLGAVVDEPLRQE